MDTTPPAERPPPVAPVRALLERRVPHILAVYAGASWGLIEFTGFLVDEFLLSPHWTRVVLVTLFLLLPSVVMLAWFHGKPGRDRDSLAGTEKIGIPANLVVCAAVLWTLFGGVDLGAATRSVTVETEEGEVEERTVAKVEFRKSVALFPFDLGPGVGGDETWLAYAVPEALVLDLMADDFFNAKPYILFGQRLLELGISDFLGVPLTLKRQLGREVYAEFLAAATPRDPTFAIAQFALYSYLVSANRSEEAIDAIRASIGNLYRVPESTRLYVKAEYYILMQELDQADAVTRMWVDLYPDDPYALTYRRTMQDIRGDREGALATLQTMSELDPRNGGLLKQIADAHEDLGDDQQALAVLSTYVDRFADDPTGYASLAALQKRLGDYGAARRNVGLAILMEPLSAPFAVQLAALDLDAGNYEDARLGYRRALEAARTPAQKAEVLEGIKKYHGRRGEIALAVEAMDAWLVEASGFMSPMMLTLSRDDDIDIFCAGGLADGGRGLRAGAEGEGEAGGTFGLTGAHPGALPRPPAPGTIFPWRPPKTLPPGNPRAPVSRAS